MSKFALEEMEFIKGKQSFNKLLVAVSYTHLTLPTILLV